MMNEARFIELIGCYGADLSRWPEDEREAAEMLLRDAPHRVRDVWESERMFDMLLALDTEPTPSVTLEARILALSPSGERVRMPRRWLPEIAAPRWLTGGAVAAALGLGFVAGYAGEPQETNADYARILSLSGAGAGDVFFAAVDDYE